MVSSNHERAHRHLETLPPIHQTRWTGPFTRTDENAAIYYKPFQRFIDEMMFSKNDVSVKFSRKSVFSDLALSSR